jgi:2-haloacid dehalogenase
MRAVSRFHAGMRRLCAAAEAFIELDSESERDLVRYETLLWDLDHTLLDSEASETMAFDRALGSAGIDDPRRFLPKYVQINRELWAGVERSETTPDEVKDARFVELVSVTDLDADPRSLAESFVVGLGACGELFEGAESVLEQVSAHGTLALVTNGLRTVQRARIARLGLERFFDFVVISSEVGAAKPSVEFFEIVFEKLGSPPLETALMIGDSLTSDIQGGNNFGIDTCWYNPTGQPNCSDAEATHEIKQLSQVVDLVDAHTIV